MLATTYFGSWDYWELYSKVTFDGVARTITVNPGETFIDVKRDLYSAWKEWASLRDFSKFDTAFRTIGGDPLGGGKFAGDLYFLINGWQVIVNQLITVEGALFNDQPKPAYKVNAGGGVISTVSNLIQTAETVQTVTEAAPTPSQIATAVWSEQIQNTNTALDILSNIPDNVWNEVIDGADQTAREKLRKIASKTQDIALR